MSKTYNKLLLQIKTVSYTKNKCQKEVTWFGNM